MNKMCDGAANWQSHSSDNRAGRGSREKKPDHKIRENTMRIVYCLEIKKGEELSHGT